MALKKPGLLNRFVFGGTVAAGAVLGSAGCEEPRLPASKADVTQDHLDARGLDARDMKALQRDIQLESAHADTVVADNTMRSEDSLRSSEQNQSYKESLRRSRQTSYSGDAGDEDRHPSSPPHYTR